MPDFEFIEHTADVGVRVYGKAIEELFRNSARALFELIVDDKPQPQTEETLNLEAENFEELLVTWLNELLSLFFAYRFLPVEYNVAIENKGPKKNLKSRLKGVNFDPYQKKIKMEIKAATYHNLKVKQIDKGWMAEIIFDV